MRAFQTNLLVRNDKRERVKLEGELGPWASEGYVGELVQGLPLPRRFSKLRSMIGSVSHDWTDESPEAKARWFQSLTMEERIQVFCDMMELVLALNPNLMEQKSAEPIPGRVQVLELPRS